METLLTIPETIERLMQRMSEGGEFVYSCLLRGLSVCPNFHCHECDAAHADHDVIIEAGITPIVGMAKNAKADLLSLVSMGRNSQGRLVEFFHEGDLSGQITICSSDIPKKGP